MALSKIEKKIALRRKFRLLRNHTNSISSKKISIIKKLKLQLEAIQKEYLYLVQHMQEVKVETIGKALIQVRVITCKKGKDLLVSILEVFEKLGLDVVHARVTCNNYIFGMEAFVEAHDHDQNDQVPGMLRQLNETIIKATQIQNGDLD